MILKVVVVVVVVMMRKTIETFEIKLIAIEAEICLRNENMAGF